jgi:thioredoxin
MSDAVTAVTDETFESEVLQSQIPVVIDLWAPWCGPCRMVAPTIETLATENAGRVKVAKIDVDQCPQTAARLGVASIPTVAFFKDGEEVVDLRLIGVKSPADYQQTLDKLLG